MNKNSINRISRLTNSPYLFPILDVGKGVCVCVCVCVCGCGCGWGVGGSAHVPPHSTCDLAKKNSHMHAFVWRKCLSTSIVLFIVGHHTCPLYLGEFDSLCHGVFYFMSAPHPFVWHMYCEDVNSPGFTETPPGFQLLFDVIICYLSLWARRSISALSSDSVSQNLRDQVAGNHLIGGNGTWPLTTS